VALVDEQPRFAAAGMDGDDHAVFDDLHARRRAADFNGLADKAERHAVLAPLE
jgi:hypothetical protein